jgi:hypothetical protein
MLRGIRANRANLLIELTGEFESLFSLGRVAVDFEISRASGAHVYGFARKIRFDHRVGLQSDAWFQIATLFLTKNAIR